jgi:RHS repeat-associated protein
MPPRCSRITHSRPFADKQCPALFICKRMRYDPWGKPQTQFASKTRSGDRGFTGHEHLAGGLIHMNGRIYDPVLGRFLSADIVVQFPDAITSYNRYAYVMNNPMAYTDPSGYFIESLIAFMIASGANATVAAIAAYAAVGSAAAGAIALATGHTTAARRFFAAAIMFATGGTIYGGLGAFAAGGIQSGSIDGAIMAAVTYGVGQLAAPILAAVLESAVSALSNAFGTQAFAQTMGNSYASGLASGACPNCMSAAATATDAIRRVELVELISGRQEFYKYTSVFVPGTAAILADGTRRTDRLEITGRRYSPATASMLEWMSWGTPFGGVLSCSSSYEQCSSVGLGFAVAGVTPLGTISTKAAQVSVNVRGIAEHALEKHVVGTGKTFAGDSRFRGLDIRTRAQLEAHISNVAQNPTAVRQLNNGRIGYLHEPTGTVLIHNPNTSYGGTVFQPMIDAKDYFFNSLK